MTDATAYTGLFVLVVLLLIVALRALAKGD